MSLPCAIGPDYPPYASRKGLVALCPMGGTLRYPTLALNPNGSLGGSHLVFSPRFALCPSSQCKTHKRLGRGTLKGPSSLLSARLGLFSTDSSPNGPTGVPLQWNSPTLEATLGKGVYPAQWALLCHPRGVVFALSIGLLPRVYAFPIEGLSHLP